MCVCACNEQQTRTEIRKTLSIDYYKLIRSWFLKYIESETKYKKMHSKKNTTTDLIALHPEMGKSNEEKNSIGKIT